MKTGLEMIYDCFSILDVPEVRDIINGDIYFLERPKNSVLEDIVINALPITNDQLQKGVFNVNIHIPNLENVVINGEADETQPNIVKLMTVNKVVVELLADVVGESFHFSAQNGGYPIRDSDLTWYMNIRVDYYAVQPNFTNI